VGAVLIAGLLGASGVRAAEIPMLDEEAVFCAYFALAGELPDDLDVEDLCWTLGRPTFSSFKPAEMFSGNDRRAVRRRLKRRIAAFHSDGLFRWELEGTLERRKKTVAFRTVPEKAMLPKATDFICADLTKGSRARLKKTLRTLTRGVEEKAGQGLPRLNVLLRPQRAEQRTEMRNIAREAVSIPIRFVVFVPVAVETPGGTGAPERIPIAP